MDEKIAINGRISVNEKLLYASMNAIDDDILLRSETAGAILADGMANMNSIVKKTQRFPRHSKRRLSAILIAATLAVLLMGAGLAVIQYGDSIQDWFAHYWELVTGQSMSEKQTALIDHLSQDIGLSQTINGVTVTVDSATVGVDNFYLLIRVEGAKLSDRHYYGFKQLDMTVAPDPIEELGGLGSYGFQFHGIDGNGAAILLIDYDYVTKKGFVEDMRPLDISITMEQFCRDPHNDYRKVLAEGTWEFSFTLERNQMPQEISLPDTEVLVVDLTEQEQYTEIPVLFTDIQLTNTGLQFAYDYSDGMLSFSDHVQVILNTGEVIGVSGGTGVPWEDSGLLFCSYKWMVPVDLDEVAAVKIGETVIYLRSSVGGQYESP